MLTTYDGTKVTNVTSLYLDDVLIGLTPLLKGAAKRKEVASAVNRIHFLMINFCSGKIVKERNSLLIKPQNRILNLKGILE